VTSDWIDISIPVHNGIPVWPGDAPFRRSLALTMADGSEYNLSEISCSAHTGTHMDAPRHFLDGAPTTETLPLDATVGKARELESHQPQRGERLLFKTRNSAELWKLDRFEENFVYIDPEAAAYLADCGVRTVGIDHLSVGGFHFGGAETHRALLGAGIWIVEGLNLEQIEPGDYEFVCLPWNLAGSDGAPARAILRKA
jgi:arylformamidase